ncbi:MAG: radical SAM protein [Candidatus Diapherotrites archaeon]
MGLPKKHKVLLFPVPVKEYKRSVFGSTSLRAVRTVINKSSDATAFVFDRKIHYKNAGRCLSHIAKRKDAKFIGFSVSSDDVVHSMVLLMALNRKHPEKIPVLGGPAALTDAKELANFLCNGAKKFVVFGAEAENSLSNPNLFSLLDKFFRKKISPAERNELEKVHGLIIVNNGKIELQGKFGKEGKAERPSQQEMDKFGIAFVKSPEYESVDLVSQRGCPHGCRFCAEIHGNQFRHYSNESVINLFLKLAKDRRINLISFDDDNFIANKKRLLGNPYGKTEGERKGLLKLIRENNLHKRFAFSFQTNPIDLTALVRRNGKPVRVIDKQIIKELKSANFRSFALGTESLNPSLRERLGKPKISDKLLTELIHYTSDNFDKVEHYSIMSDQHSTPAEMVDDLIRKISVLRKVRNGREEILNNVSFIRPSLNVSLFKGTELFENAEPSKTRTLTPFHKEPKITPASNEFLHVFSDALEKEALKRKIPKHRLVLTPPLGDKILLSYLHKIADNHFQNFQNGQEIADVLEALTRNRKKEPGTSTGIIQQNLAFFLRLIEQDEKIKPKIKQNAIQAIKRKSNT